jgi:hypothetical protein
MRNVCESLLPWKRNTSITYWPVCACVRVRACMWVTWRVGVCMRITACHLANPVCNAYAPRCDVISGPSVSTQFFDIISKTARFSEKISEHKMCVMIFPTTLSKKISHSKKNLARYRQKCRNVLMWSTRYFFRILMQFEPSRYILEKSSNIKFHRNPSNGSQVVPCGQTDGRTDRQTNRRTWRS